VTFDYARSRATAERLIARFGTTATLHQITTSGDAWAPTTTETDTTVRAVDLSQRLRDASGTLTGESLRTLYVSTSAGVTPAKGDKITVGGIRHEIAEVRTLNPGGVAVMHEVDLAA